MFAILKRHKRFFLAFTLLGFALRWIYTHQFHMVAGDGLIYGDIALNLLKHGVYGLSGETGPVPTLIRLPGYPLFLAAVFSVFGAENYRAAMYVQMFIDIGTCFVVADLARRVAGERASRIAFVIAALCPLTINFVSVALTETLALFFTAVAFDLAVAGFQRMDSADAGLAPLSDHWLWIGCGLATGACILVRPDSGLILITLGPVIAWRLLRGGHRRHTFVAGVLIAAFAFAPLVPWAVRNWRVFHVFQPLAPYSATDPDEPVLKGFGRWTATWVADYSSLEDLVFNVPGETADFRTLPNRAFDTPEERARTQRLFEEYADAGNSLTSEMDADFGKLADERTARHPLRTHVWLPVMRMLDMWFRPRTEFLPLDIHWWNYRDDINEFLITISLGVLNLLIVAAAIAGLLKKPRMRFVGPLVLYIVLRTVFFTWAGTVEPRYMMECFPLLFVFAARFVASFGERAFAANRTGAAGAAPA